MTTDNSIEHIIKMAVDMAREHENVNVLGEIEKYSTHEIVQILTSTYEANAASENAKLKRLLEDLTPGGSEFVNDPEYCATWVKEQLRSIPKTILPYKQKTDALRIENEKLRTIIGETEGMAKELHAGILKLKTQDKELKDAYDVIINTMKKQLNHCIVVMDSLRELLRDKAGDWDMLDTTTIKEVLRDINNRYF